MVGMVPSSCKIGACVLSSLPSHFCDFHLNLWFLPEMSIGPDQDRLDRPIIDPKAVTQSKVGTYC